MGWRIPLHSERKLIQTALFCGFTVILSSPLLLRAHKSIHIDTSACKLFHAHTCRLFIMYVDAPVLCVHRLDAIEWLPGVHRCIPPLARTTDHNSIMNWINAFIHPCFELFYVPQISILATRTSGEECLYSRWTLGSRREYVVLTANINRIKA